MNADELQILQFLQSKGFSNAQAAGIMGNLQVESGGTWSPRSYNPKENAVGIAQWEKGRRTNLMNYATSQGGAEMDLPIQLNFMWQELNGPFVAVLKKIRTMTSAGDVAAEWDQSYEISSGDARQQRIANANAILAAIGNNKNPGSNQTRTWATPGHWLSYLGKPISDPPKGTFTYGKAKTGAVGTQSGDRPTDYPVSDDDSVWTWMMSYFDDGSLASKWGKNRPDHPSMLNEYGALLGDQRQKAFNEVPQPDPGPAQAGLGPLGDFLGAITDPIKFIGQFFKDLAWIFNVSHFIRFCLYVFGFGFVAAGLSMIIFGTGKDRPA